MGGWYICIYIYAYAVDSGSGAIFAVLKVRFWPKTILAYFYSGFKQLFVQKLALCVLGFWNLLSATLLKRAFLE